jgi:transposase
MQIRSVRIGLGKTTHHLVALGDNGKVLLKKKFTQKHCLHREHANPSANHLQ